MPTGYRRSRYAFAHGLGACENFKSRRHKAMINFEAPTVWMAPMAGVTDAPMRRQAAYFGAPAVVSEMVAGEMLARARPDVVRRTCRHEGGGYWIVQLAARRPEDMFAGAVLMAEAGVDVIDINMGCPAKQVTGGQSGSALMRNLPLAGEIIDAAVQGAAGRPVTLKMRLGWDENSMNAPSLAVLAQDRGVRMLTVHARTRCQFYAGQPDWGAVRAVTDSVSLPVLINGDITDTASARRALCASGAHGVMIGRGALGAAWIIGQVAAELAGRSWKRPGLREQLASLCEQISDSETFYGPSLGLKMIRKHVSAAIERVALDIEPDRRRRLRSDLCRIGEARELIAALERVYLAGEQVGAVAA